MTIENIIKIFKTEFQPFDNLFEIIQLTIPEAKISNNSKPGVYVYYKDNKVIRIGRSFTNSRKRALEHIRDNTSNELIQMKNFETDSEVKLLLFNVIDAKKYYWTASLEIFLEIELTPVIRAARLG